MADMRDDLNLDKKYIRRRLRVSCREEQHRSNSIAPRYINIKELSSHDAENYIMGSEQGLKAKFIRIAFKKKESIKKIPFIGRKILSVKNDMLKKSVAKLNTSTLDVSHYLEWYKTDFISAIYEVLLQRKVDENGLNSCLNLMRQGASKGAIVYLIATSDEFGARGEIAYLKQYKKEYKRFILKQRVIKVPILGKVYSIFTLKSQLSDLYDRIERTEAIAEINTQRVLSTYNQLVSSMQLSNTSSIDVINHRIKSQLNEIENRFSKNIRDIREDIEENARNIREDIEENARNIREDIEESSVEIRDSFNINVNTVSNSIGEGIANIVDNVKCIQGIDTSISQKLDVLPNYISQAGVKNKSIVTGIPGGITAVIVDDFIMGIPSEEWGLAMFLSLNGHFEPGTEKCFEKLIEPGMTVLDIGANLGIFTLRALRGGCNVYAYEPTPSTYRILNQNIKANGYWESDRWNTFNLGVFNKRDTLDFCINEDMCGHNSIFEEKEHSKKIQVEVVTIDEHLKNIENIDVVKIDAEGAEIFIMQGMKNVIMRNPQIKIILEFAPTHIKRAGISFEAIFEMLREYGLIYKKIDEHTGDLKEVTETELIQEVSVNLYLERG